MDHKRLINDGLSDLKERIDTYCDALIGLSEMYDSPVIFYNMYLVWTYRYEMLQDYEAMIGDLSKDIREDYAKKAAQGLLAFIGLDLLFGV